jgi:hypothetical protein
MYIEDLIGVVSGVVPGIHRYIHVKWAPQEFNFLASIGEQIMYHNATLTEKQGLHALKILDHHRADLRHHYPNIDDILANPQWKKPFRVLPTVKSIKIGKHEQPARLHNGNCILLEFPYETELVESMRKRNLEVHELHKGHWDGGLKQWVFALTETNVGYIGDTLLSRNFQASDEFLTLYAEVLTVRENIEQHLPMLVNDNGYKIKNSHNKIPQLSTDNLSEALFAARTYGITNWDDNIEREINSKLNFVTKSILSFTDRVIPNWFDSHRHSITEFKDLITYGGPILIIVPGGNEATLVKTWTEFAISLGIPMSNISAMFRLPNEQADFNIYVRETGLNNPVTENTQIVFVSTKITKPLVKSNIKFTTVINLGYYNYMHYSMSAVVDNAANIVYYSMKAPTKTNKWQPQEL